MTEVDARLEQFLHGYVCQCVSLVKAAGQIRRCLD